MNELGMKFSGKMFDSFICKQNGRITAVQIQEEFNINAELFDQFMVERILSNHCTFYSTYGRICKNNEVYIFPKLGSKICPYCLK
tara:strand:+ start:1714 stop:1968 length:255 start_codon:yes stop_codon:yes gene_type:complete